VPKATEEESVPVKVRVLETVRVFPSASVSVAEVAGAVSVTLLTEVAVATPKDGVVKVGEIAKTKAPLPVSSVTAAAKLAEEGVAKKVAMPVPRPDMPVETGRFVALARLRELGVPKAPPTVATVPEAGRVRVDPAASPTRVTFPVVIDRFLARVSREVTPVTETSKVPAEVPTEVKVS